MEQPKKKPGRPRKPAAQPSILARGIVTSPSNAGEPDPQLVNVVELEYTNPIMFKRIFSLLKSMEITDVSLVFRQEGLVIVGLDSENRNTVYVNIHGKKLTSYYCHAPLRMGIQLKGMTAITNTISKDFSTIRLYTNQMDQRSYLKIELF